MNSKLKFVRFAIAMALVLGVFGVSAPAALAAPPIKSEFQFEFNDTLTDLCSFPVTIDGRVQMTEIDYFNASGALTRVFVHVVEQDTFSANGKTLPGLPYTFNQQLPIDSNGLATHIYAYGIVEKVPLPDGSLFISAGWLDFRAHPGASFLFFPDRGVSGNVAGFCAALAP